MLCVSENAAALEELLLEYESKQLAASKGSSIKYVTHVHTHSHKDARKAVSGLLKQMLNTHRQVFKSSDNFYS